LQALGLTKLLEKLKAGETLTDEDYALIKKSIQDKLGDQFNEMGGLNSNYEILIKDACRQLGEELELYTIKIPELGKVSSLAHTHKQLSSIMADLSAT
jgi:hypothetical protein